MRATELTPDNSIDIASLIKRFDNVDDQHDGTAGFCGTFALSLYRFLNSRGIRAELFAMFEEHPKFHTSGLAWRHIFIKSQGKFWDITGEIDPNSPYVLGLYECDAFKKLTEREVVALLSDPVGRRLSYSARRLKRWREELAKPLDEGHELGSLVTDEEGEDCIGYWFQPRSGQHYVIAWDQANAVDTFSDHCDIVFNHPEWFGKSQEEIEEYHDCDTLRYDVIQSGWVRVGYAKFGHTLRLDARNAHEAAKTAQWFTGHHGIPAKTTIDIITETGITSYLVAGDDNVEFIQSGRLMPHTKTQTHSW